MFYYNSVHIDHLSYYVLNLYLIVNNSRSTIWTLHLKIKMVSIVWGLNLHGRPMGKLAFHYDKHEEIKRYICMRHMCYDHPTVMRVFCLPLTIFGWFCYSRCHKVQFNMFYKICTYTDFFTLNFMNYFCFNNFLNRSPHTIAAIFTF